MAVNANDAADVELGAHVLSDENDDRNGYCVHVYVLNNGTFEVNKGPISEGYRKREFDDSMRAGNESTGTYENIGQTLRAVLTLIRDNPIDINNDRSQFESGLRGTKRSDLVDVLKNY